MASPVLLAQRTTQAILDEDVKAFSRWTGHPRWRADSVGHAEKWILAALGTSDPIAWLQRLEDRGVSSTNGGYPMPAVCEAARLGKTNVVEWLLDHGARLDAVSDYGLGRSLGHTALANDAREVMAVLWKRTGRLRTLLRPGEQEAWLEPSSLPLLKSMCDKGWSIHHPEPDPEGENAGEKVSFAQWMDQQDSLEEARKERLIAALEEARLEQELPGAPCS